MHSLSVLLFKRELLLLLTVYTERERGRPDNDDNVSTNPMCSRLQLEHSCTLKWQQRFAAFFAAFLSPEGVQERLLHVNVTILT